MRRALLAWEGGGGRGHLVTLKTVAEALSDRFEFDAALCRMDHAGEIEALCEQVFPAAYLWLRDEPRRSSGVGCATWGEYLGDIGFRDQAFLARQIAWWQEVIRVREISLVIGDFAPCALLAARGLGVPACGVGTGYSCPPAAMAEFPVLLGSHPKRIYDEAEMLAAVNAAATPLGVPEFDRLPAIYDCDDQLVRTLPMLDPYVAHREGDLLPPVADVPGGISDGAGEEVFVYFSTTERANPALMEALEDLGAPTRLFMPNIAEDLAARLAARGVIVERAPVPVDLIARRSRLILHAGQHGILCLGLACGLPQVAVPQHMEQLYHARRAEEAGVLRVALHREIDVAAFRDLVRACLADEEMARRARSLARDLRPLLTRDPRRLIRRRVLAAAW
ncbi:glycosyltransferase [Methylopila turkensis]|uniref:Glycosyl transferase family 28 C-terminal domain-containing protein n=1 Tax=Methylopila turkensis TaxID=1437816 RepID=A0A9W6N7P8_9HYPH|nr:hypothetical protein [Methylopila turkensis]GLK81459.1 hypothetical protein GCM10008174_32000 [Methylopila turkensis]